MIDTGPITATSTPLTLTSSALAHLISDQTGYPQHCVETILSEAAHWLARADRAVAARAGVASPSGPKGFQPIVIDTQSACAGAMTTGQALRDIRLRGRASLGKRVTQEYVAKAVGTTQGQVSRWERDLDHLPIRTLTDIAHSLGLEPVTRRLHNVVCGDLMTTLLDRSGLTNVQVAALLECTTTTVEHWRSGMSVPKRKYREALLGHLHLPASTFDRL